MSIATELNDDYGIGVCHSNLGSTREALGSTTDAIDHYLQVNHTVTCGYNKVCVIRQTIIIFCLILNLLLVYAHISF